MEEGTQANSFFHVLRYRTMTFRCSSVVTHLTLNIRSC